MDAEHQSEVNGQLATSNGSLINTEIETSTDSPFFSRLPFELREKVFMLLFANQDEHTVWHVPTYSPRSSQLLRVCKRMHSEASPVLYRETAFEYSCLCIRQRRFLPTTYRPMISDLTLVSYSYMAQYMAEYPGLRKLTIRIPTFLRGQAGAQALLQARSSPDMRSILAQSNNMPLLEIAIEGESLEFKNGGYVSSWRRRILKKATPE